MKQGVKLVLIIALLVSSAGVSAKIGLDSLGDFGDAITGLKFGGEKVFLSVKYNLFEGAGNMMSKLPEAAQGVFSLKVGPFEFSLMDEIKAMLNGIITGHTDNEFIAPMLQNSTVKAIISGDIVKKMAEGLLKLMDKLEKIGVHMILFIKAAVLVLKDIKDNIANGARAVMTAILDKLPDLMILLQRYFKTAMETATDAFKNMTGKFAEVVNRLEVPNFFDNDGTKLPLIAFFQRLISEFSDILSTKFGEIKEQMSKFDIFKRFMTIAWKVKQELNNGFGALIEIAQSGQEAFGSFKNKLPMDLQSKLTEGFEALKIAKNIENASEKGKAMWEAKKKLFPIIASYVKFDIGGKVTSIAELVKGRVDEFRAKVPDFSKYKDLANMILGKFNVNFDSLMEAPLAMAAGG